MKKEVKTTEPAKMGPEKKIKAGAITAIIWPPREAKGKTLLVAFEKSYKDKEDNWATTNNFTAADLPAIAWLAREAFSYLVKKAQTKQ